MKTQVDFMTDDKTIQIIVTFPNDEQGARRAHAIATHLMTYLDADLAALEKADAPTQVYDSMFPALLAKTKAHARGVASFIAGMNEGLRWFGIERAAAEKETTP